MNQRTYLGTTYLDIAKGAVEVFMKVKNNLTPTSFQASVQPFYLFIFCRALWWGRDRGVSSERSVEN